MQYFSVLILLKLFPCIYSHKLAIFLHDDERKESEIKKQQLIFKSQLFFFYDDDDDKLNSFI